MCRSPPITGTRPEQIMYTRLPSLGWKMSITRIFKVKSINHQNANDAGVTKLLILNMDRRFTTSRYTSWRVLIWALTELTIVFTYDPAVIKTEHFCLAQRNVFGDLMNSTDRYHSDLLHALAHFLVFFLFKNSVYRRDTVCKSPFPKHWSTSLIG